MCGIFGIILKKKDVFPNNKLISITNNLYKLSSSRGKDASGIAISTPNQVIVYKESLSPQKFIKTSNYKNLFLKDDIQSLIGQARMETNGSFSFSYNNQPIIKDEIVSIHNGIIVNDSQLWSSRKNLKRLYQVDTEIINSLTQNYLKTTNSPIKAIKKVFQEIEGSISLSLFFSKINCILLATNTGSLYLATDKEQDFLIFASERYFLESLIQKEFSKSKKITIKKIQPQSGLLINLDNFLITPFDLLDTKKHDSLNYKIIDKTIIEIPCGLKLTTKIDNSLTANNSNFTQIKNYINEEYKDNVKKIDHLHRCTKCVLPETMPFIQFDENGVCNYCNSYKSIKTKGIKTLKEKIKSFKNKDGKPDCVVAFSGGRDSSYSLHFVKKILGLNPIAFSYDWGMLTDLGRRNQARMTGKLGIEHLLVSADISKKRENIHKNVSAWLKKPNLGTIPLFMAGDKQYFYYANKIKKENNIDLVIMGENYYEKTSFKNGFAKVRQDPNGFMAYHVSSLNKIRMLFFYAQQFILNPSYINSSVLDSFKAFFSYFLIPHDYINIFDYIKWDEKVVNKTLKQYNWELSPDTDTTWRIGDGTVSFYNYIYYTVAGFSEIDTFVSNQIREGDISREEGLKLIKKYNQPRPESIKWYCDTIKIDMLQAIKIINNVAKLY